LPARSRRGRRTGRRRPPSRAVSRRKATRADGRLLPATRDGPPPARAGCPGRPLLPAPRLLVEAPPLPPASAASRAPRSRHTGGSGDLPVCPRWIRSTEDRRPCDVKRRARLGHRPNRLRGNAAVHLDGEVIAERGPESPHLVLGALDESLSTPARVHRHAENEVHRVPKLGDRLDRRPWID